MKRALILMAVVTVFGSAARALAHCEVPCGVYDDERRFVAMLEDQKTIAKAITSITELAAKGDALSANQLARWVSTKEAHATNTQHIIAQYFMTQRIKAADQDGYVKKLSAAHAVMVAAMKCKQTVDPAMAQALDKSIRDFHRVYEGK